MVPDAPVGRDHRRPGNVHSDLMLRHALRRLARCSSSDCTTALDPNFPQPLPAQTGRPGLAGAWCSRNTGPAARPTASIFAQLRQLLTDTRASTGRRTRVKAGYGGGTIAQWFANSDIDAADVGIGVLSMHSPMDVSAKADLWELYRGFRAFPDGLLQRDGADSSPVTGRLHHARSNQHKSAFAAKAKRIRVFLIGFSEPSSVVSCSAHRCGSFSDGCDGIPSAVPCSMH